MRLEVYLQKLEDAKTNLARAAMEKSGSRDAFDYGRATGIYAGLEMAKAIYVEMFADKERRDKDL